MDSLQPHCCSDYLICAFLYRKRQQAVITNVTIENLELVPVGCASLDLNYVQYKDAKVRIDLATVTLNTSTTIEPPLPSFTNFVNTAASVFNL